MPALWWAFRRAGERRRTSTPDVGRRLSAWTVAHRQGRVRRPVPDESYKTGRRAMPLILPTAPDDPASEANRAAWQVLGGLDLAVLVAFSDSDPITGPMRPVMLRLLPGAARRDHPVLRRAGRFVQEDAGPELADHVLAFARVR